MLRVLRVMHIVHRRSISMEAFEMAKMSSKSHVSDEYEMEINALINDLINALIPLRLAYLLSIDTELSA